MNVFKIAWRSIQHRGLGSVLTVLSMALGVMLVVAVLTVHGVVSRSFKSVSTFPYDLIVATSGSGMQVTMNTVFYLSSVVENIPYEYYLAFADEETRNAQFKHSMAYQSRLAREQADLLTQKLAARGSPASGLLGLAEQTLRSSEHREDDLRIGLTTPGSYNHLVDMAIPVNLGDYLDRFRVVGTVPDFFQEIYLDIETKQRMKFAEGRPFKKHSEEHGFFEAVLGAVVAQELNLSVGDIINPIHGDPNSPAAHTHEQGFTIVGVLERNGTPHDRAAFVNMEGFFLMEDHAADPTSQNLLEAPVPTGDGSTPRPKVDKQQLRRVPLPIEQREVTAVLLRSIGTSGDEDKDEEQGEDDWGAMVGGANGQEEEEEADDEFVDLATSFAISGGVNEGALEGQLQWSDFRPLRSKDQAQAVSPVQEVTVLFENFVNPIRWILLVLTVMICIVSGISILVGIYNSMAQRRHEIAVMRALGASRSRVMTVTLLESITLAMLGGMIGWVAGHGLNALASPYVEAQTGVTLGFFDFAPGVPILTWLDISGISFLSDNAIEWLKISPELFLIPGLILLAVMVGLYPAITAYRTDVAESLGT